MQTTRSIHSQEAGARFVIAVFDDWQALQAVLDDAGALEFDRFGAVLHAREDDPPTALSSGLLKEIVDLRFERSTQGMHCTRGEFAEELAARLAGGAHSLAEALQSWLSTDQAWQLQSHIEKGRLALWLRLRSSEDSGTVCGRLVQASPHMVGLCTINFKA
jgi:hypothetical protein